MAGAIIGSYGFQRSGKTLISFLIAEKYRQEQNINVYSNMKVPDWVHLERLSDLPVNNEPKVLLLDEAYFFLDSRNWKNNAESTIFFNTIGKQNILLLLTAIDPSEVDIRIRRQHNYLIIVKKTITKESEKLNYRLFDIQRDKVKDFNLQLNQQVFNKITYDTLQIPMPIDLDIKNFIEKVKQYNNNIKQ